LPVKVIIIQNREIACAGTSLEVIGEMATRARKKEGIEIKKIVCWASPGCHARCGLLAYVKNGRIEKIKGNPEHPVSQGQACRERMPYHLKWLYHPDQLMYPLKRAGERGDNRWERISWEKALDEIVDTLKKIKAEYGAESLAFLEGTLRSDLYGIRARFQNLFGNPGNIGNPGTVCHCNIRALRIALTGSQCEAPNTRMSRCIVLCGKNMSESEPIWWRSIKRRLREKPKPKLIVIDPRYTECAKNADMWLQIRPGTDTALFLAWIHVIIGEHLFDEAFIDKWTFGFDQLKQRASEYTPERVADITWIPAEKIRESARMYATHKPASLLWGVATDHIGLNGMRAEQARVCLRAITGNMAAEGAEPVLGPGPVIGGRMGIRDSLLQLEEKCPPEQREKQLGADRYKLMTWPGYELMNKRYKEVYGIPLSMSDRNFSSPQTLIWRAILTGKPYPVRAIITWSSNPLVQAANTKLVYKALKSSNLGLHVVLEHFMTPTAMLADYVLPAASKLEKAMLSTTEDFSPEFMCGERAIMPLAERRSDYQFFRELAIRLGFGEYFPWETEEGLNDYRLEPLGITFREAATKRYIISSSEPWTYETINPKTGGPTGFATPSGKIELCSNILKELGYDPLPFYEEPPESPVRTPDIAKDYPLTLITGGRFLPQFHSEQRQLGMGMREQHPDPLLDIHPDTARALGIADGDWVYVETRRGVIKQKAKLTTGIDPRVVNIEASWWFPEQPGQEPWLYGVWQSNANVLTQDDPDACDPLTGGWPMRALLCKVYKVQTP
jgi:anaerobic selenocysteine-containing dehydrogenase